METKIDKRVQKLFDVVQEKKKAIAATEAKPRWNTNLTFGYDENSSNRVNLNVVNVVEPLVSIVAFLLDKERSHKEALKVLEIEGDFKFKWMGYTSAEWIEDVQTKLNKIQVNVTKKELAEYQAKLDTLVSPEMKRELELVALEKDLL